MCGGRSAGILSAFWLRNYPRSVHIATFFLPVKGQGSHPCSCVKNNFPENLYSASWMFYVPYVLPAFWNAQQYLNTCWKRNIRATIVIWSAASLLSSCCSNVPRKQQSNTRHTASGHYPHVSCSVISAQACSRRMAAWWLHQNKNNQLLPWRWFFVLKLKTRHKYKYHTKIKSNIGFFQPNFRWNFFPQVMMHTDILLYWDSKSLFGLTNSNYFQSSSQAWREILKAKTALRVYFIPFVSPQN